MKDLDQSITADKTQVINQRQVEKQLKFIGSSKLIAGHKCFEINEANPFELEEAQFETMVVMDNSTTGKRIVKKVMARPGFIYVNALNKTNALKKLFKALGVPLEKKK